jgi:hypothetical protein
MRFKPVEVECRGRRPIRFRWRRQWRTITRVQEVWQDAGEWWSGEDPCWFWRVAAGPAWFELVSDLRGRQWWLYRVYD